MTGGLSRAELQRHLEQQKITADFVRFILRTTMLQSVLDEACRVAAEGTRCGFAAVLEQNQADHDLLMRASSGWRDGKIGEGAAGQPVGHGVKQSLAVPIATPDWRFGILEIDVPCEREFDPLDRLFLQTLADLIAMAVTRRQPVETPPASPGAAEGVAILAQADLRMLEMHHRVKNSLQLVQSLLLLQGRATLDRKASADLVESAARIRTIAAIHDRLYRIGSSSSTMNVAPYLDGLIADLRTGMISTTGDRRIVLVADPVVWPVEDLSALGLVLTELVTNAIKHGTGVITVTFHQPAGSNGVLTVCDQGQLPADLDPACSRGFGMRLIRTLLQGEGAGLQIDRQRGCSCFIGHMPPTRIVAPAAIPST